MQKSDIDFASLPDAPGVYFFMRGTTVLYVGKATSLRSRVRSYFDPGLADKRSPLVAKAVADAKTLRVEQTDSVLEALLLEVQKIKELRPHGNTESKDDKSYSFVVITRDEYPRVLTLRGRELSSKIEPKNIAHTFGPFTSGSSLKEALKIIRRIFPFFDSVQIPTHKLRFNQSIGLYPNTDAKTYKATIRHIVLMFEGKMKKLISTLEAEMRRAAKSQKFEEADMYKRQLFALRHIQDIALVKDEYRTPHTAGFRIEAFDTAHLGGASARGVMVAVVDGVQDTSQYRIFTIRTAKDADDYQALREVLTRRFAHREWLSPQLIVIDGGAVHKKVASETLKKLGIDIEICAVVKDSRHKAREIIGRPTTTTRHKSSILLANAEAHRFSIASHRKALRHRIK